MIYGITPYQNSNIPYLTQSKGYRTTNISSVSSFDYKVAQRETKAYLDNYQKMQDEISSLKKDSLAFLDRYNKTLTAMGEASTKLEGNNLKQLLFGKNGTASEKPSDDRIEEATKAVQSMVDTFNTALKTLNDNAGRGVGVTSQIRRMVQPPTSQSSMALVGISIEKDGSLKLDQDKLKTSLKNNTSLAMDIIGGSHGIAQGITRDALTGLRQQPASLINGDLSEMSQKRFDSSLVSMANYSKTGAVNMMNLNSVGVLMNILI